jgi:multidrug resistance protein MdtO
MASIAQPLPNSPSWLGWLGDFLKQELAPYEGRAARVARIVVASTLVMIICMTFRLPYGVFGGIYALILSHESLASTAEAVRMIVIGFVLAGAWIILGMILVLGDPILRFLWIVGGFFTGFWIMSVSNYAASGRFGYLIAITVALWDEHISPASKVENTLWAVGVLTIAGLVTLQVDAVFAAFRKSDDLMNAIAERLTAVEDLLTYYLAGDPPGASIGDTLARLAMTGTSRMRQVLSRSGSGQQHIVQMSAVVALSGRLVDLAANLAHFTAGVSAADHDRIGVLAQRIRDIRGDLTLGAVPEATAEPRDDSAPPPALPLLGEMERTVSLLFQAFTGSQSLNVFAPSAETAVPPEEPFFSRALLAHEHVRFALRGCLAASSCYIIFNVLAWPEISTSVTTCFVTALTTIGASRQKQFLRFAGALIGGFGLGMGSQIFILPYIDSIAGFTMLFIPVIAAAAWIAASGPRLSYLGLQIAVAFSLINLQEFRFQTSLAVARDRVVGILLGLLMMWLFFDRLWSTPTAVEMRRTFVATLRLLAGLTREQVSEDVRKAIAETYEIRDTINAHFDRVRSLADGVLFEFGPSRQRDLETREQIRRLQPQFQTLFVMRIASLKYRLRVPGFEVPETVRRSQEAYDELCARALEQMADRVDGCERSHADQGEQSVAIREDALRNTELEIRRELPPAQAQSFVTLLEAIDVLTTSLTAEIEKEL